MKKYIETLKHTGLFSGVKENEISAMLNCLQAKLCIFKKGEYVFREGEHIDNITVLVEGKLLIQRDDYWGNRSIVNVIRIGEMFGEAYVAPESGSLLNDVVAEEDTILDDVYRNIRATNLMSAIDTVLDSREKTVIRLRYGLTEPPKTQKETAVVLGISRSYVSRIEKSALQKLKDALQG